MKLSLRTKLLGSFLIVTAMTAALGLFGLYEMSSIHDATKQIGGSWLPSVHVIGQLNTAMSDVRRLQLQHTLAEDKATMAGLGTSLSAKEQEVERLFTAYEPLVADETDGRHLADARSIWASYLDATKGFQALSESGRQQDAFDLLNGGQDDFDKAAATFASWADYNNAGAEAAATGADGAFGTALVLVVGATIVVVLLGIALALVISRGITRGVQAIQASMRSLAEKCVTWLAEGMDRLASNDMTYAITPVTPRIERYGTDEIGDTARLTDMLRDKVVASIASYNEARTGLTGTIIEVQEAAEAVSRTSEQLNEAATQTGAATQQVATTISQVAGGTAEQARAASDTNAAVQELSAVIGTVGQGAAETSASVGRSLDAVSRMQAALHATDQASAELAPANVAAATALDKVTATLRDTADGMARIKTAVDESAVKVAELGAKGEQIGAIVETIDDIAEQTNLLALNAAIEAARAGEMGKGFAVVADEVRKLAERSGRATKEIASLIAEVQKGTSDAVRAMETGAKEVEEGLVLGQRGSASIVEIGSATDVRNAALERVFAALHMIEAAAADVTRSSDEIASVVEGTTSGVRQMTVSAESVSRSIGSIAAVSEENSAASEEVSAATEEMSAQAEEVVASAATLAEMAAQLDALVARFVIDTAPGSAAGTGSGAGASSRAHGSPRRAPRAVGSGTRSRAA